MQLYGIIYNMKNYVTFTGKIVPDSKRERAPAFSFGSR